MKLNETPLSYKLRLTIFCLFTTQNIGNSMIPVFIGYMVYNFSKDLARETDRESYTAFYVGIIEANNKLMSFVGSFIWGYVSDKISKKNTLIWVLVGNIISFTLLGIADKYWVAFAARTLAGLCAGIVPVTKALIKSTTDDSNYARLFSYCGNKYKGMGTGFGSLLGPLAAGFLSYPNPNFPVIFDNSRLNAYPFLFPNLFYGLSSFISIILVLVSIKTPQNNPLIKKIDKKKASVVSGLLANKKYMLVVCSYGLIAATQIGYRILIALWVKTPAEDGGLGWKSTSNLGIVQGAGAVIIIVSSYWLVPFSSKMLGNLKACILCIVFLIPLIILCSFVNLIAGVSFWFSIIFFQGSIMALFTSFISLISIEISNSVHESVVGSANGLSQGLVALYSALTSAITGWLYGWTISNQRSFPLDYHFAYFFLCIILVFNLYVTWMSTEKTNLVIKKETELSNMLEIYEEDSETFKS